MRSIRFSVVFGIGLLVIVSVLAGGCGRPSVVPVEGKVTFEDGTTLPEGTRIVFNPVQGGQGTASGKLDADGSFKLTHVRGSKGAEPGKYTVSLLAAEEDKEGSLFKLVGREYVEGGKLSAEVKSGTGPIEFRIPKKGNRR